MRRIGRAMLAAAACAGMAGAFAGSVLAAEAACASPRQMQGFKTCADVSKAEEEGEVVVYATDPEGAELKVLAAFNQMFPKIKPNYVRLQAGALYAKITSERQAGVYTADSLQLSDMGMIFDFQKKNGYLRYVSPELAAFKPQYRSQPEGDWAWGGVTFAGIAYNSTVLTEDQAPKSWEDMLDPKWADQQSVKVSTSGLQHLLWYELRQALGAEYWKKYAAIKPRAFDSYVQQYDRLINRQDKLIHGAQYSGYIEFKAKGAPLAFVAPATGVTGVSETWGIPTNPPHPQAARLFMDWFLSPIGQKANGDFLFLHSVRDDVPAPPGGVPIAQMKVLLPEDWTAFFATKPEFNREWDKLTGLR